MAEEKVKLIAQFPKVMHMITRKLMMGYTPSIEGLALSTSQRRGLLFINENKRLSMTELYNCVGLEKGSLTTVVDQLIKKGLVERQRDEKDRRKVYVTLTPFGEKQADIFLKEITAFIQDKLKNLTLEEVNVFFNAITSLIEISKKL